MAILLGRNISPEKAAIIGRSQGVVQGQEDPDETPAQALARIEQACIWVIKRTAIQLLKRERIAAELVSDMDDVLTIIP